MSAISWTGKAFPPWFGCSKVSRGCDNCYAEAWTLRFHKAEWGPHGKRNPAAESTWQKPHAWQRWAVRNDQPLFVFASEVSDVFDNKAPVETRTRLWRTISATPALIWLVLTKRPQNFRRMLPADWGNGYANAWLGCTAENQREANLRLPLLCRTPAVRRFVSAEPLLEHVDLSPWLGAIDWLIAGCESGPGKRPGERPTDLAWVRSLRDRCQAAGTAFWLKQLVIDGKVRETPELDGRTWTQRPEAVAMT